MENLFRAQKRVQDYKWRFEIDICTEKMENSGVFYPWGEEWKEVTIVLWPKVRVMPVFWAQERYLFKSKTIQAKTNPSRHKNTWKGRSLKQEEARWSKRTKCSTNLGAGYLRRSGDFDFADVLQVRNLSKVQILLRKE